jgi:hypothetical protein
MPQPVKELLRLVHVEQLDLSQVKRVDFEIIIYLKESHPDLYRTLRRAAKSRNKRTTGSTINLGAEIGADESGDMLEPEESASVPGGNHSG